MADNLLPRVAHDILRVDRRSCPVSPAIDWVTDLYAFVAEAYNIGSTADVDFRRVRTVRTPLGGTAYYAVSESFVTEYCAHVEATMGPKAAWKAPRFLAWYFGRLQARGVLKKNPAERYMTLLRPRRQAPRPFKRIDLLTASEAARVRKVLYRWQAQTGLPYGLMFDIFIETGLRVGELLGVTPNRIGDGAIYIHKRKNGHPHTAFILPETAEKLRKHLAGLPPGSTRVWVARSGRRKVHYLRWARILAKATIEAGVAKHVTPHSLRHFCATQLAIARVPHEVIQQILGHADIKSTMRYIHVPTDTQQRASESTTVKAVRVLTRLLIPREVNQGHGADMA